MYPTLLFYRKRNEFYSFVKGATEEGKVPRFCTYGLHLNHRFFKNRKSSQPIFLRLSLFEPYFMTKGPQSSPKYAIFCVHFFFWKVTIPRKFARGISNCITFLKSETGIKVTQCKNCPTLEQVSKWIMRVTASWLFFFVSNNRCGD